MLGLLTILLCLFAVTFHEFGHAWAMRAVGVPIRTISLLGFKLFNLPYFNWTYQPKWQKDPVNLQIHPFLIGAYVLPDQDAMKTLSAHDTAFTYGAGPFASIIYGLVMFALSMIAMDPGYTLGYLAVTLVILTVLYLFRRFFCQYIMILLGVAILALFLSRAFSHPHEVASTMGGPVMITQQFHAEYAKAAATKHTLETVFFLPGMLSIALGLTNAIPLVPFDGGHIVHAYLSKVHKRASDIYAAAGFALFAILMIASIGGDINLTVNWVVSLFR